MPCPCPRGLVCPEDVLSGRTGAVMWQEFKTHGALVGGIVPEYLLPADLFFQSALAGDTHGAWAPFFEDCFSELHNAAWATLLLQVSAL